MALTPVNEPRHKIDTPGFEDHVFGPSSPDYLTLPQAVAFASEQTHNGRPGVLQSQPESVAVRIEADGTDNANQSQITRTCPFYFRKQGVWHMGVADSPNPEENILLAHAQDGYDAHNSRGVWTVGLNNQILTLMLEQAEDTQRVVPINNESYTKHSTIPRHDGTTPFGTDQTNQALLQDQTEPYATFLREQGHSEGYTWTLTPQQLNNMNTRPQSAEIRVGWLGCGDFDGVGAYFLASYIGRARGVWRREAPASVHRK